MINAKSPTIDSAIQTYQPYYDLIIEACKTSPDDGQIRNQATSITEWSKLIDIAYMHGVLPLVYKTLKHHTDVVPSDAILLLKTYNMQIARTNMQMTSELLRVVKLLDEHGIKYMALKGPVLSQIIHGDTIQRQYTDLDILVEKEDIYRVGELLYANSYTSEHDLKFLKNKALLKIGKDFTFRHEESNIFIEVHWNLFIDRFIKNSSMNLFTPNLLNTQINYYTLKTLELEYLLVYLCLHGSQHFWERISWVVDIDRLIRLNTLIDWTMVQSIIEEVKIESKFYLGLAVVNTMFNTVLPDPIQEKIVKLSNVKDQVFKLQFSDATETMQERYRKHIILHTKTLVADNIFSALRNYLHMLFRIKEDDIYLINLPYFLSPLYYVIRQFKLLQIRIMAFVK